MIKALLMMLILGGILGCFLGVASKIFYVEADKRVEEVTALLPGYNCGGCGYPGCSGMAEALCAGEAQVTACKPSKQDAKDAIIAYLKENPGT